MTETKTVLTTKEIETIECSSCGQETPVDKAYKFFIHGKSGHEKVDVFPETYTEGWACRFCANKGPAAYPSSTENTTEMLFDRLREHLPILFAIAYGCVLALGLVSTMINFGLIG